MNNSNHQKQALEQLRVIRAKQVEYVTGLSRTTIWRKVNNNTFPAPLQLGPRSVGWRLSEVEDWVNSLKPTSNH